MGKSDRRKNVRPAKGASAADSSASDVVLARAVQCYQAGQLLEAKILYEAVLAAVPDHPLAMTYLAVLEENVGNADHAEELLRKVVERHHGIAQAYEFLGILTRRRGLSEEASVFLERAAKLQATDDTLWARAAESAEVAGQTERARKLYERCLAINPDNELSLINLGNIYRDAGDLERAEALCRRVLAKNPRQSMALNNLGHILDVTDRQDEAQATWEAGLEVAPKDGDILYNLGSLAQKKGEVAKAEAYYRRAIEAQPKNDRPYINLGKLLIDAQRASDAWIVYQRGLAANPDSPGLLNNFAGCCMQLRRYDLALEAYARLEELGGRTPITIVNHGLALAQMHKTVAALENYLRAIYLQAEVPWPEQGVRAAVGVYGEITDDFRSLLESLPSEKLCISGCAALGAAFGRMGSFKEFVFLNRLVRRNAPKKADAELFTVNYSPEHTAEEVFAVYRAFYADREPVAAPAIVRAENLNPDRPLRIGYVSPDFNGHSCSYFVEPLLEGHDRGAVELVAYAEQRGGDETTDRMRRLVTAWRETSGVSDDGMAAQVRDDRIDILVDIAGHTAHNRLNAMAYRPAPVQATWMGYAYTTGAPWIDYFIGDEISSPVGCEHLFAEQIARLPFFLACYRPPATAGDVRPAPALERGYVTFGTLTRSVRVNERVIGVWSRILREVPDSRLVLNSTNFTDEVIRDVTIRRFERNGIAAERLDIGCTPGTWQAYGGIDITLDCFPHNSGTTSVESLWAGVPFISLVDRPSVGRLGASILATVGRPEWIAWNEDEYVRKAAQMASDIPRLSALRAGLRDEVKRSPLVDEKRFARAMELLYRRMWQRHCDGLPPAPLRVELHEV